jgi:hypothetical protein
LAAAADIPNPPTIVLVTNDSGATLASASIANPCGDISVALTPPAPPAGAIAVTLREQCPDGSNNRAFEGTVSAVTGTALPRSAKGSGTVNFSGLAAGSYTLSVTPTNGAAVANQTVTVAATGTTAAFVRNMACTTVTVTGG